MASKLSIYRLVANHLGQEEEILSPGDDTRLTRAIGHAWDGARRAALRANNWNFATVRRQLPADTVKPAFEYDCAFTMPEDFVRLVDVVGPFSRDRDWVFEGGKILANAAPLLIRYVYDCTNVTLWDDLFEQAMSIKIAELICTTITGNDALGERLGKRFSDLFSSAQQVDATENPPVDFDPDPWLLARAGLAYGSGWPG